MPRNTAAKGGRPPAIPPEQLDEAMRRIQAGEPVAAVARSMGLRSRAPGHSVQRGPLYREAYRRGILTPPGKSGKPAIPAATADRIRELLAETGNVAATARAAGVSRATVRKVRDAG